MGYRFRKQTKQVEKTETMNTFWESQMDDCVMLEKTSESDGEGGRRIVWHETMPFKAAIVLNASVEALTAQAAGVTSLYKVHVFRELTLEYHEVFKRVKDGKVFRVTSDGDDIKSPLSSFINMSTVTAEEWRLES